MAATRSIEIRTEIPGPRSREILERGEHAVARPLHRVPADRSPPSARNATITDVDGNTFVDFAGGVGVVNVGHCHPRVVEAIQEQAARFLHTDFTVVPYEAYIELAERLGALAPIAGRPAARSSTPAPRRSRTRSRSRGSHTGRPAVIAFEGGVPRPHAAGDDDDVEDAPVQDGTRPVRAGGLPRAVPERLPRPSTPRPRSPRSSGCSRPTSRPTTSRRSSSSRSRARAASCPRRPSSSRGFARICDEHGHRPGRRRGADRLRPHRADVRDGALRRRAGPDDRRQVDRRRAAALGRDRQGRDHGRAARRRDRRHVTSATRSRSPPRSPSSTSSRRRSSSSARELVGDAIRARMLDWQARWPRSATFAASARCSRSSSSTIRRRRSPRPSSPQRVIDAALQRGLILLKAGVYGNCIRVLCPLTIEDAELDEALAAWEDALAAVLAVGGLEGVTARLRARPFAAALAVRASRCARAARAPSDEPVEQRRRTGSRTPRRASRRRSST